MCYALENLKRKECFPPFTTERCLQISFVFEKSANFPHCVGALNGKHVRITKPTMSGSLYFNYKKCFSIVLFAVADANYNFLYIDVGSFGREGDSTIFENSSFYKHLMNNSLNIPRSEPLPHTLGPNMPYTFVGDEAFGLSQHIMRPYKGKLLTKTKRIFNYRLSWARRYVECTFGILSNKWRIFHRPMDVNVQFAISVTKTCCLLHNYVRSRDSYIFVDTLTIDGLSENSSAEPNTRLQARGPHVNAIRNDFSKYFESDGKVS